MNSKCLVTEIMKRSLEFNKEMGKVLKSDCSEE